MSPRSSMMKISFALFAAVGSANAQPSEDFEKVLLPIAIRNPIQISLAGAYGSSWTTELSLINRSGGPVSIVGYESLCQVDPCFAYPVEVPAGVTLYPPLISFGDQQGYLLEVEKDRINDVHFLLRVQDLSRQAETWGTQIPVIKESDALTSNANLLDIPSQTDFRSLLRVYDFDADQESMIRIRIYGVSRTPQQAADELVLDTNLLIEPQARLGGANFAGYAQLSISDIPETLRFERLRVELDPRTDGLRYWGFVSVTNNVTQHVTTITPQ